MLFDHVGDPVKVIIITGTMGSGKTTVMAEASDLLTAAGLAHAAIDLDTLGMAHLPQTLAREVEYRNLASVCANYQQAGVTRLLIAAAVENDADLDRIFKAVPDAEEYIVCRLKVDLDTAQRRVRTREPGILQDQFVARARHLDEILDEAKLENFSIENPDGSLTDVARQIINSAKWI
jgi:hypothetical protein